MKTLGIITGIIMCILGGCAMAMPFRTFLGIGWLVGALFLVYGVQTAITAMQKEKKDGWTCALGVLAAILGIWITFSGVQRALTDMTIAYLVGALLLASGVLRIMSAVKMFKAKEKKQGVILALCGVLAFVAGFIAGSIATVEEINDATGRIKITANIGGRETAVFRRAGACAHTACRRNFYSAVQL